MGGTDAHPQRREPVLSLPILIAPAEGDAHYAIARELFTEYVASLGVDLGFQGFAAELQGIHTMYAPPAGVLLLAWREAEPIGCIGIRARAACECEMKRLYLRPGARGTGLGRTLALRAIDWARQSGYRRMCLDTLASMSAARALYRELGFQIIEPYYQTPLAGTTFMELEL
jgi:putative acetyltransferase